jgi:DNA-directed RNA polymerase specialized sigma24 family protein
VTWHRTRSSPPAPETRTVVLGVLATLPPRARAVVVLRYWEDLSVDQTAVVLGCSPGNVKSLAAGALGKLRVVLDEALTGCDPAESHPEEHHEAKGTRHG